MPTSRPQAKFRVRSDFGGARQWRSRKHRPCDACRRRKTVCVIDEAPPCRFCSVRGLDCRASQGTTSPTRGSTSRTAARPAPSRSEAGPRAPSVSSRPLLYDNEGADDHSAATSPEVRPSDVTSPLSVSVTSQHASPQYSAGQTTLLTLEDRPRRTAHSIGLAGEQDTGLLALFRSSVLNEQNILAVGCVQVYHGDLKLGEPPIHMNVLMDKFLPQDDLGKAQASEAIERIVGQYGRLLVRLYFQHVHPLIPLVSRYRFLRAYAQDHLSVPASLRGVVYALGASFWNQEESVASTPPPDVFELFQNSHESLLRENHAPDLWTLQAALLLVHERPGYNYACETPRTWISSAQAVAASQMIGLHRECSAWSLAEWEKALRRKLWWATYVTDVWSATCHGNPTHISTSSFTTQVPTIEGILSDDAPQELLQSFDLIASDISVGARFMETVKLSSILHELLDAVYSDAAYQRTGEDPASREQTLLEIQTKLATWSDMQPSCLNRDSSSSSRRLKHHNYPLTLAYFAVKALICRALSWPTCVESKQDETSALRRFFDSFLQDFEQFTVFIESIDDAALHSFWGAHARSQLLLCGSFLIHLFLMAPTPSKVEAVFDLLSRCHLSLKYLQRLARTDDASALIRPIILRMDSFVAQASEVMSTATKNLGDISLSGALG